MLRSLAPVLRATAKSRGLTQEKIARRMKVSLPTVKRWFAGKGLDLKRLDDLLKILGLSFRELAELTAESESKEREFTLEQETAFARHPALLAYFEECLAGKRPKPVPRYLRDLEKLGLVERHPGEKIKVLFTGQPRWRMNGPLARSLKKRAVDDFLAQHLFKSVRLGLHRINAEDVIRLEAMLVDLQAFARSAESRARHYPDQLVSIGLLVGCGRFNWALGYSQE